MILLLEQQHLLWMFYQTVFPEDTGLMLQVFVFFFLPDLWWVVFVDRTRGAHSRLLTRNSHPWSMRGDALIYARKQWWAWE